MSTLTGQQIKDTYDGLLKLADSTTGITSTYQQIQDGLGNDTNTRISTQGILSPNVVGMNNLKPDFGGAGFGAGASGVNIANSQNKVWYTLFYDPGYYSYSGVSYNISTLSTTSDIVNLSFYTLQLVPGIGIAPKDLILSGITFESSAPSTTGFKTTVLPSTLSFSGTGGGFYIAAFYVTNGGVTPTIRYTVPNLLTFNQSYATSIGVYQTAAGTGTQIGQKYGVIGQFQNILNNPPQASYTATDIQTNYNTTILTQPVLGYALRTIF